MLPSGQKVKIKTRLHVIFVSKMQGPFLFICCLDWHGRVAKLQDNKGNKFDHTVPHLVEIERPQLAVVYRRRNLQGQILWCRNLGDILAKVSSALPQYGHSKNTVY